MFCFYIAIVHQVPPIKTKCRTHTVELNVNPPEELNAEFHIFNISDMTNESSKELSAAQN
jgi:hypothetical protein